MNAKIVVAVCAVGLVGGGIAGYIYWKRKNGEGGTPSSDNEHEEDFRSEESYDGFSEGFDESNIKINDPKMYNDLMNDKPSYDDGKPPIGQVAAKLSADRYSSAFKKYTEDELKEAIKKVDENLDIPEDGMAKAKDDILVSNEIESDAKDMPWDEGLEPISLEEFLNGEPFFDKLNLLYFVDEEILAGGDRLEKMEPVDTIGLKGVALLESYYRDRTDSSSACVIVRNKQEGVDYQCYTAPAGLTYEEAMLDANSALEDAMGKSSIS